MATSNDINNNYPYMPLSPRNNTTIEPCASLFDAGMESQAYQETRGYFPRPSGMRHTTFQRITSSEAPERGAPRRTLLHSSVTRLPVGTGPTITEHLFRPAEAEAERISEPVAPRPSLSERRTRRLPISVSVSQFHGSTLPQSSTPASRLEVSEMVLRNNSPRRTVPVSQPEHHELGFGIDSQLLQGPVSQPEILGLSQPSEHIESQAAELVNIFEAMENNTSNLAAPEVWESIWDEAQLQNMAYESARNSSLTGGNRNSASARALTPFTYSRPVSPRSSERSISQRLPPASRSRDRVQLSRGSRSTVNPADERIMDEALARNMSAEVVYREHYRRRQGAGASLRQAAIPPFALPPPSPPPTTRISSPTPQSAYTAPSGDSTCCICLDTLASTNQNFTTLRHCNHAFHRDCIHHWLQQVRHGRRDLTCPLCRQRVSMIIQNNGPNNEVGTPVDTSTFLGRRRGGIEDALERPRGALMRAMERLISYREGRRITAEDLGRQLTDLETALEGAGLSEEARRTRDLVEETERLRGARDSLESRILRLASEVNGLERRRRPSGGDFFEY